MSLKTGDFQAYFNIYSDGANSVKVIGCDEWSVSLYFGKYDALSTPAGAYDDFVTEKIYEDNKGGMLA